MIMFLYKVLTRVDSQKKPRLHFGESFTLRQQQLRGMSRHVTESEGSFITVRFTGITVQQWFIQEHSCCL